MSSLYELQNSSENENEDISELAASVGYNVFMLASHIGLDHQVLSFLATDEDPYIIYYRKNTG